ncbi:MAG: AAA family ATPase [Chlorobi bacterium]|nr:AAA family ATPase [Chlorobiota bacterium]
MKEIVVISGKGGTGKTSITASLAYLGGKDLVLADCDVDAADMHLLMQPEKIKSEDFYSGLLAKIDPELCTNCGICANVCRFNAIPVINNQHIIKPLDCEGCGYCEKVCPEKAIIMEEQNVGFWQISNTRINNKLVHARLGIGAENSGKLVAKVKNEAKQLAKTDNKKYVLIDGSPGVGCSVVSSLSGANYVLLVTEPTVSGIHDLRRVYTLVKKFSIKAGCIINKYDLNYAKTQEIIDYLQEENIEHIASLPYDEIFIKAIHSGKTIVEYDKEYFYEKLKECWNRILELIEN